MQEGFDDMFKGTTPADFDKAIYGKKEYTEDEVKYSLGVDDDYEGWAQLAFDKGFEYDEHKDIWTQGKEPDQQGGYGYNLQEDFPEEYAKAYATATGNEEEVDVDLDGVADYDYDIYVPPHVKDEDLVVRADSQNYRLPVEFLVDMAEQFGDMGNDAMSFVDETIARFVKVGMAEAEKDKLYNWFDNIWAAEGTMRGPEYGAVEDEYGDDAAMDDVELGATTYLTPEEGEDEEGYLQEGFNYKKWLYKNA